jgi:hypothetical protein
MYRIEVAMNQMPSHDAQNTSRQECAIANSLFNADLNGNGSLLSPRPVSQASTVVSQDNAPTQSLLQPVISPKHKGKDTTIIASILVILVTISGAVFGTTAYNSNRSTIIARATAQVVNATATAQAHVNAAVTAQAHVILSDPLSTNLRNFPVSTIGEKLYIFKDGAYHMTNLGDNGIAVVLQEPLPKGPIGYTLTMEEIKGDDTSTDNSFGMILRYSQKTTGNQTINTFYSFEVFNYNGGQYRFYKYDNSQGPTFNPWMQIWSQDFGHEFHQGHGPKSKNTIKVFASGNSFTFIVNGKAVGTIRDNSFTDGTVGMLVNLKGTEVAFSNMLITND